MAVKVTRVEDHGDDVLVVHGQVDGVAVTARGWVSAMTNHFPGAALDKNGNRDVKATPTSMNDAEKMAYWQSLLVAAAPTPTAPTVIYGGP